MFAVKLFEALKIQFKLYLASLSLKIRLQQTIFHHVDLLKEMFLVWS